MKHTRAAVFLLCVFAGCSDAGGPFQSPRIDPGIGIDGVRIGYPRDKVRAILGTPDGGGLWDGLWGGGVVDRWRTGPHAGLDVYYRDYFQGNTPYLGPADYIGVGPPFAGTTREGIGPGSRWESVLLAYPAPLHAAIDSAGSGSIVVCGSGRYTFYQFIDSAVWSVGTGYFDPPPPGALPYSCR